MQQWLGQHAQIDTWYLVLHDGADPLQQQPPCKTASRAQVCVLGSQHSKFCVSARHTTLTRWDSGVFTERDTASAPYTGLVPPWGALPCQGPGFPGFACKTTLSNTSGCTAPTPAQGTNDILALYLLQACRLILLSHKARC